MKLKLSRHAFTRFWDVHAWSGVIGGLAPTFVGALVLCVGWAFAARDETAIWWQGLGVAGVAMLLVPITATRWSDAGLFGSGHRLGAVVGVDVALLLMSFALLGGAAALRAASVRSPRTAALKTMSVWNDESGSERESSKQTERHRSWPWMRTRAAQACSTRPARSRWAGPPRSRFPCAHARARR